MAENGAPPTAYRQADVFADSANARPSLLGSGKYRHGIRATELQIDQRRTSTRSAIIR